MPGSSSPDEARRAPRRPLLPALTALALGALLQNQGLHELALWIAGAAALLGLGGLLGLWGLLGVGGLFGVGAGLEVSAPLRTRAQLGAWGLPLAALLLAGCWGGPGGEPVREAQEATGRLVLAPDGARGGLEEGAGRTTPLELEPGLARDGERLRLLPGPPPARSARGPEPRAGGPTALRAVTADEVLRLAPVGRSPADRLRRLVARARAWILARVDRLRDPDARGLAAALLLGDRSRLPPGLGDLFTRTGVRHALAISGLHVGLVAALFLWPAGAVLAAVWRRLARGCGPSWLGRPAPWRAVLLALFAPLAGGGAPVVRAGLALSLAQLAPTSSDGGARRVDALSLWATAALVELAASPQSISSLSLALSYCATLGLIVGTGPARRAMTSFGAPRLARTTRLGRPLPAGLLAAEHRVRRFGATTLALSLAASLATLPIVWSQWGEWGPLGLVLTPLLVPLLTAFLAVGWGFALLPWTSLALGRVLEAIAGAMVGLLQLADRLPLTPASLPARPTAWLAAVAALALFACVTRRRLLWRLAALAAGITCLPWALAPARLELAVLDVGHGTACVLRAPGSPCWLFDAGSRDRPGVARAAVAPWLRRLEVSRVAVVLSHTHRDHAGALDWLVERFPPTAWMGALPARLSDRLPRAGVRTDLRHGSAASEAGGELRLRLVRGLDQPGNEGSRSLVAEWRGERLILCGDAEANGLEALLAEGFLEGPCELLLFPHHGSDTAHLGELLRRTRPAQVWISSSSRPPVADELDRRGTPWRVPALHGPLQYPGDGTLSDWRSVPPRRNPDR